MVGGPEAVFERVSPLFALIGKNITLVGGNGDGQTAKVANQIIMKLTIEAVAEALLLASRAGRLRVVEDSGSARRAHGQAQLRAGFRIVLHQKDLNLALSTVRLLDILLFNTATVRELFNACTAHGGKAWDHSAMARALEKMANFEIGQKPD